MKLNRLYQTMAVLAIVFAFVGCDDEFTNIGGEIITNPSNVEVREVEVNAYSQKVNSIQTNNLSNHILGVYDHPVYGESTASLVSQLTLATENPDFGDNVELDSVVMTIPYFSTQIESADDEVLYELDSLYGNESFKLSIYETSYFLNDLDPDVDFEQRQKYYSDQGDLLEQNIVGDPLFVEENFKPSALSFTTYEVNASGESDTIVNTPALKVKLPLEYFQEKIINKEGSTDLLNNSNFRNYLRNFLIKAEPNGSGNSQVMLDFSSQNTPPRISIYYTRDSAEVVEEGEEPATIRDSFVLFLSGNRFNTFQGEFPGDITQEIEAQTSETGAENLYLKAEEGSMAVIELFPDAQVLEDIRNEELLVNEADLVFYVNNELDNGGDQPRRLVFV